MRLLFNLALMACSVSVLTGCCSKSRHRCCLFGQRYDDCVGSRGWDDDEDDDCAPRHSECGCGCGSEPAYLGAGQAPWTSECGCTTQMPAYSSFAPAPMTYGVPDGGCNCETQPAPTPTYQPVYNYAPMMEPTPTPAATPTPTPAGMPETYYSPRPASPTSMAPPVPPMTIRPAGY